MRLFLKNIIDSIKRHSFDLDKISLLCNQPWVQLCESDDYIKLIFKKKGKLIVSHNGFVTKGRWEHLTVANSLLLDMNEEIRLYNHEFMDDAVMVMKLDGKYKDYFILVNEAIIPDLNLEDYLERKYITSVGNSKSKLYPRNNKRQVSSRDDSYNDDILKRRGV